MRERARYRALSTLAVLRVAQRGAAQASLVAASQAEAAALADRERARGDTCQAALAWDSCLRDGFDPDRSARFAGLLTARVEAEGAADAACRDRAGQREAALDAWHASDGQCRQGEEMVAASRRRVARDLEAGRLDALADRVTYRARTGR